MSHTECNCPETVKATHALSIMLVPSHCPPTTSIQLVDLVAYISILCAHTGYMSRSVGIEFQSFAMRLCNLQRSVGGGTGHVLKSWDDLPCSMILSRTTTVGAGGESKNVSVIKTTGKASMVRPRVTWLGLQCATPSLLCAGEPAYVGLAPFPGHVVHAETPDCVTAGSSADAMSG